VSHSKRLRRSRRALAALLSSALVMLLGIFVMPAASTAHDDPTAAEHTEPFKALVFSKTAGFRHASIPAGIAAIEALGTEHHFDVDTTEDSTLFTDENLAQYDVVIWLSTTGDVLNNAQQDAFERYIQAGGGYVGIHSASDTEYGWPWYGELVGAYFANHPANQTATIKVEDPAHASTAHLGPLWERFDEWYNFQTNPRGSVHVLASLDETSYNPGGGAMGAEHPIAWCHDYDGGRAWYTALGHTNESFVEAEFLEHLLGGIQTAAGVVNADCGASLTSNFEKVALDESTLNPMKLDVADDGRVFYIDRNGAVRIIRPDGSTTTAGTLGVYTGQEFGLLGIALDPGFATNDWIYLYYSPTGSQPLDRVSRFTMDGDTLDMGSEVTVLEIDTQRTECCHAGGALAFDTDGNLYIATGDLTNPFASAGYTPIDERPGREFWDAQRTSANSNNLNGKIVRITPQADGSYTIPEGNMFAPGTAQTRPEIYAMGFRNPFTIGVDPQTNSLLVADYGPDAGSSNPNRGPDGRVEWNIVDEPGFYGWPYCVDDNTPFIDFNFANNQSGAAFDCAGGVVNDSPNNDGITQLPPAIGAELWMGKSTSGVPEVGPSGAPMTSGTYRYDDTITSDRQWPAYWDGKTIMADWNNGRLFSVQTDESGSEVVDVNRIFPEMSFLRPMAFAWGPDGALYVIDWGSGFGGNNANSGVYRIDYLRGTRDPIARLTVDRTSGPLPLTVEFSSAGSQDPEGTELTFAWDFDGDGTTDSTEPDVSHTYTEPGTYLASLTVTTEDGRSAVSDVEIVAGNTAPTITVDAPINGGFFDWGDVIQYSVTVTDPEDGEVDCADVVTQPALGHDDHSHGYEQYFGCEGSFPLPGDEGHIGANIFGVITVTYTDKGGPGGAKPLTSQEVVVLHTKHKEAEYFTTHGRVPDGAGTDTDGVEIEDTTDEGGGQNIGFITDGDYFGFEPMNLTGIDAIQFRVASNTIGGTIEVRVDDPEGPLVGAAVVEPTGGWQTWETVTAELDEVPGDGSSLYFVVRRPSGSSSTSFLMNVNWMKFVGVGITDNSPPVLTASADPLSGPAPLTVDFTASATDPDGDDPITFEWAFGDDGATADTADATHTYVTPGTYTAEVTATDARGASASESFEITVEGVPGVCIAGRSDDFGGDELDRDRWSNVIRENQDLKVEDGHLVIPATNTDIYGTNNTDTPNIVLQPLPDGPFTATAKLTFEARRAYQQAGLVIYGDDDNYAKMVFQGRNTNVDDANARIFQFIREENGAPNEVAASNTASLGADYPDTVWVRFTSDGSDLQASYSSDGETFTDMPQTKSLAGIEDPHIGLISLSGTVQSPLIDAKFDWFQITPDDTVGDVDPNDEFNGPTLDECRWNAIVRPNPAGYRIADGHLEIDTSFGDIWEGANSDPENFILQDAPDGDWTIETKVDGSALDEQYQQGGLMVYVDDGNYVKFDYVVENAPGQPVARRIELRSEIDDVVQQPQPGALSLSQGIWHLRLTKEGDLYRGAYSADGEDWTELDQAVMNAAVSAGDAKVGVFALGGPQLESKTVRFEYFRVDVETDVPSLDVSVVAGTRCAAGRAMVTVVVTNEDSVPVSVDMTSAYGSKSFDSVEPGKNAFHAFTTRQPSVPDGSVSVEVSATVDGEEVTVAIDAAYDTVSCN
jgi:cytochrome c